MKSNPVEVRAKNEKRIEFPKVTVNLICWVAITVVLLRNGIEKFSIYLHSEGMLIERKE